MLRGSQILRIVKTLYLESFQTFCCVSLAMAGSNLYPWLVINVIAMIMYSVSSVSLSSE